MGKAHLLENSAQSTGPLVDPQAPHHPHGERNSLPGIVVSRNGRPDTAYHLSREAAERGEWFAGIIPNHTVVETLEKSPTAGGHACVLYNHQYVWSRCVHLREELQQNAWPPVCPQALPRAHAPRGPIRHSWPANVDSHQEELQQNAWRSGTSCPYS